MRAPQTIIKRPLLTEKSTQLRETGGSDELFRGRRRLRAKNRLRGRQGRQQDRDTLRHRDALFNVKVTDVHTMVVRGKRKRLGRFMGQRASQQEGHRDPAAPASQHRVFRGSVKNHGDHQRYKPTSPGRRGMSSQDFLDHHQGQAREEAAREKDQVRRSQQPRPDHVAVSRWRPQAALSQDRLQAQKDRRAGHGSRPSNTIPTARRASRSCIIADGEKVYILAPGQAQRRRLGHRGQHAPISSPVTTCPCASSRPAPRSTAWSSRSAAAPSSVGRPATRVVLMAKEGKWATLRLPSGEMRKVHIDCRATIGARWATPITPTSIGARPAACAGAARRPHNRGVSMNPVDHPMGGGEGRSSGGRHPCTPVGRADQGLPHA